MEKCARMYRENEWTDRWTRPIPILQDFTVVERGIIKTTMPLGGYCLGIVVHRDVTLVYPPPPPFYGSTKHVVCSSHGYHAQLITIYNRQHISQVMVQQGFSSVNIFANILFRENVMHHTSPGVCQYIINLSDKSRQYGNKTSTKHFCSLEQSMVNLQFC